MVYKIFTFVFILIAHKCLADMNIYVHGMVISYKKDIYTVKVDKDSDLILIRASELNPELKERLNRKIGRRIQMGIPGSAISLKSRKPASQSKRVQK